MLRTVLNIIAFLGLAGLSAYLFQQQQAQFQQQREQYQSQIVELQNRLVAQEIATEEAAFENVENRRLFAAVTDAAQVAKSGSPLHTLVNSSQLRTLREADYERISEALETRTPIGAMQFLMESYKLTEAQAETLAELLGRRKTRQQDAPGTSLPLLERFKELTLSPAGLDGIELGMTAEQAGEQLGVSLDTATWKYGDEECASRAFGYGDFKWLLRFILREDKVGKIDIYGPGISTDRGIEVGMPMQSVFETYPEGTLGYAHDPNERIWIIEIDEQHYLEFQGGFAPHNEELDTATVAGAVSSISLGRYGVGTVEGCL